MLFRQCRGSLSVFAPAKLNLFLEILGRRADGFHELETLMISVGIYDTLVFREGNAGETQLLCHHFESSNPKTSDGVSSLPVNEEENLAFKAAKLLREYSGTTRGVRIGLFKRIPIASGLAGGSSDAAATLAGLNRFWNLGICRTELIRLAGKLGSDVGFFLSRTPLAICRGRGEIVTPVNLPGKMWFVIVRPCTGLSTPAVFRECQPAKKPKRVEVLLNDLKSGRYDRLNHSMYNALQKPAGQLNQEIFELRKRFSTLPISGHMMTGSGTAYFGVCTSRRHAENMASRLKRMHLGSVFVAGSGP
ncbi:MAG: 4-(cytidine 5'-diphospho)-2-C-methyl-D-erythritol kinase [Planctomycetaceae bacterium]